jgi:hypothetical protein
LTKNGVELSSSGHFFRVSLQKKKGGKKKETQFPLLSSPTFFFQGFIFHFSFKGSSTHLATAHDNDWGPNGRENAPYKTESWKDRTKHGAEEAPQHISFFTFLSGYRAQLIPVSHLLVSTPSTVRT